MTANSAEKLMSRERHFAFDGLAGFHFNHSEKVALFSQSSRNFEFGEFWLLNRIFFFGGVCVVLFYVLEILNVNMNENNKKIYFL